MRDRYHALRSALIAAVLPAAFGGKMGSAGPALTEQTREAIEKCISRSAPPWPDEWKKDYIDTIRSAIESHGHTKHYAERLEILAKGFGPYWESFTKTGDRSHFDVHLARIRWYVEHLLGTEFPSEQERRKLRDQYTEIWDHAATSLLAQFPFLDPNAVRGAKTDHLNQYYRKIETPLMPVYLRPMSEEQVGQIKQRWHDLRYARVDLWRSLGGDSTLPGSNPRRDYRLTQKSLAQLDTHIWAIVATAPDYYRSAMENRIKALEHVYHLKREARTKQQRMEKGHSRQLAQSEHIGFLLGALLETARCFDGLTLANRQEQTTLGQPPRASKGGGAHEVEQGSREK